MILKHGCYLLNDKLKVNDGKTDFLLLAHDNSWHKSILILCVLVILMLQRLVKLRTKDFGLIPKRNVIPK